MIPYRIDFNAILKKIEKWGFNTILLQLPEGMQVYAMEMTKKLKGLNVFISANPCYGACDIETHPGILTIQIGHSRIPNINYPENIIFVEAFSDISPEPVVEKFLKEVNCNRIGITAAIQHINQLDEVRKIIENSGKQAIIGRGDSRITYPGQVLGCNFSTARNIKDQVDCFIFLGSGIFHALGIGISTKRDVYALDPYSMKITKVDANEFLKRRYLAISSAMRASKFGIVVSSKIGQKRMKLAYHIKEVIEECGREAYLIMTDNIIPENMYYDVDVYVNTACPRVTYDEYTRFKKPVITANELMIALGKKDWNDFSFDEIVEVD